MTPAFWIAFFVSLYLIFDAWRTLRMMEKFSDREYDKRNMYLRVAFVTLAGLALLALVIWMESVK